MPNDPTRHHLCFETKKSFHRRSEGWVRLHMIARTSTQYTVLSRQAPETQRTLISARVRRKWNDERRVSQGRARVSGLDCELSRHDQKISGDEQRPAGR